MSVSQSDFSALTSSLVTDSVSLISDLSVVEYIQRISWSVYSELAPFRVDKGNNSGGTYTTNTAPTKSLLIAGCSRLASCSARDSDTGNKSRDLFYPQFFLWYCAADRHAIPQGMTVGDNANSQTILPEDYSDHLPRLGSGSGSRRERKKEPYALKRGVCFCKECSPYHQTASLLVAEMASLPLSRGV